MQNSVRYLVNGNSKAYLRDMVAGHHCSRNGLESEEDRSNKRWGIRLARVKALAMAASAVRICSRKKGKANRPSKLEEILLGYYIRLRLRSQESCVYLRIEWLWCGKQINMNFGIKLFLSQNWGACVYTKIWEGERGTESFQDCVNQGIDCMRIDIS